jgi:hypothetical protein
LSFAQAGDVLSFGVAAGGFEAIFAGLCHAGCCYLSRLVGLKQFLQVFVTLVVAICRVCL